MSKQIKVDGEKLKRLRIKKDFSQEALAKACSCSQSLISQIERGVTIPSESLLDALKRILETKSLS